mmetsp:Transcript_15658/g.32715  ORF Transcript_15658/g.32715 Transcript_15658/m.32715 type:complete len:519 (-) Transcript_15658:84-1640(-)
MAMKMAMKMASLPSPLKSTRNNNADEATSSEINFVEASNDDEDSGDDHADYGNVMNQHPLSHGSDQTHPVSPGLSITPQTPANRPPDFSEKCDYIYNVELVQSTSSEYAVMATVESNPSEDVPLTKERMNEPARNNFSHINRQRAKPPISDDSDSESLSQWWFLSSRSESVDSSRQGLQLPQLNTATQVSPGSGLTKARMSPMKGGDKVETTSFYRFPDSSKPPNTNSTGVDSTAHQLKNYFPSPNVNQSTTVESSVTSSIISTESSLPIGPSGSSTLKPVLKAPKYNQNQQAANNTSGQKSQVRIEPSENHPGYSRHHYATKSDSGGDYTLKEQNLRRKWLSRAALGGTINYDQNVNIEISCDSSTVAPYQYIPDQQNSFNADWDMTMTNEKTSQKPVVEWTPQDSSYGAAFPAFGWIPKRIRKLIESVFYVVVMSLLIYAVVKTGIMLNSGNKNSGSGSEESDFWDDDDHYLANKANADDDGYHGRYDTGDSRTEGSNDGHDRLRKTRVVASAILT